MESILAIDIHDECISGVLLRVEQRVAVVVGYSATVVGEGGVSAALAEIIQQTGYKEGEFRLSIGAESLYFRNLVLPFTDRKKVERVLPFELEELTSHKIEQLHLDFLSIPANSEGTEVLAAMVEKSSLAEMLAVFQAKGLDPDIIAVSGLQTAACLVGMTGQQTFVVLDISFNQATLILVDNGRIALVRSLAVNSGKLAGFAFAPGEKRVVVADHEKIAEVVRQLVVPVQQTLLSVGRSSMLDKKSICYVNGAVALTPEMLRLLAAEMPLEVQSCNIANQPQLRVKSLGSNEWDPALMNRALALALWNKKLCPILNFRKGTFRKQRSLKSIRKMALATAMPIAVILVGIIGFSWWEFSELDNRIDALKEEIELVFKQALPEVTRITDPVKQLQVKVNETRELYRAGSQGAENFRKLDLLAELSTRIPENLPVRITRLVADTDDVRIRAETRDFNTVDNVKRELEKSAYFDSVVISSANLAPQGGEVRFELRLEFKN